MQDNPLISYIMPAKCAQETIEKAISSITNAFSSLNDYEIIIVLHDSADPTYEALRKINHPCLRVLYSGDKSVAHSRNCGIEAARGDYIGFLDSDDELYDNGKDFYKNLVSQQEFDLYFGECKSNNNMPVPVHEQKILRSKDDIDTFYSSGHLVSALWEYYIRRSYILDNKLRFIEALYRDEDTAFCAQLISTLPSIFVSGRFFISYTDTPNSLSKSYTMPRVLSLIEAYSLTFDALSQSKMNKSLARWGNNYVDIFLFSLAFKTQRKNRKVVAKKLHTSSCHALLRTSNHRLPKAIYKVLGYRPTWALLRLFRKKSEA